MRNGLNWIFFFEPSAYLRSSDLNVVVLNWWVLARGPHYETAAKNTKEAGRSLADFLDNLIQETQGEARRDLHVVGFSLGAQVAGIAAGQLKTGRLPRITGPCTVISHERLMSLFVFRWKNIHWPVLQRNCFTVSPYTSLQRNMKV
jgi:hypothetical protein